ncbi:MAG: hypothetical protein LBG81_06550, partial [Coriobacteriaceae bacterium]|nr:hypothetical protein [Coriobacteriaceae bacterium]
MPEGSPPSVNKAPLSDKKPKRLSPARKAAWEVGILARKRSAFVQEVIASNIDASAMTPADKAFATRLALGVAATWGTLDELIDRFLDSPEGLQAEVRDALRISCYEMLFLGKSPHAAVDQGVELVRSVTHRATGLANAVLRKIAAAKKDFPFGDPAHDLAALARLHAFPLWLASLLVHELGWQKAASFMEASNQPPPIYLAVNPLKCDEDEVIALFDRLQIPYAPFAAPYGTIPGCLRLLDPHALRHRQLARLFDEGKVLVSDAASQMVAALALPVQNPASFLEIGAGRGTKTILLQGNALRRFGNQMSLSILDSHHFKVRMTQERSVAYGVRIDHAFTLDATLPLELSEGLGGLRYDAVLVDAPCSGLGTLRRHPEIRWKLTPEAIASVAAVQEAMLAQAAALVAPGGMLTYSTCTVGALENEGQVGRFMKSEAGKAFRLLPVSGKACFSTCPSPDPGTGPGLDPCPGTGSDPCPGTGADPGPARNNGPGPDPGRDPEGIP